MKKTTLFLSFLLASALLAAPVEAADNHVGKDKTTGQHNFEQWQTIKRLQIPTPQHP
ncbi:MAG TPA: hypothetical protein VFV52_02210 [Bacilli bacterium]|nr:hypothetical protein [Bacilli bacterium]